MLLDDLRYALRSLRKSPGFTLTALLTLALGIGATSAIFTLVYDVMLAPLPFSQPGRLVVMEEQVAEFRDLYPTLPMNVNNFLAWQKHSHSFQSMAIMEESSLPLGAGGSPHQIGVLHATPGIFSVLDVAPALGRAFTPEETQRGHEHVAILMDGIWRRQFQADPAILGRTITLDGYPYTVIGVMPKSFHLPHLATFATSDTNRPQPVEALLPMTFWPGQTEEAIGDFNYFGLGRLKPDISVAQANSEINALQHTISANLPADAKGTLSAVLTPFQQVLVGDNRKPLLMLLDAVAGLLVVGCVNIANLLLARAAGQRQQIAVAAALGASRAELLRMAMRETVVLAAAGGGLGILLAATLVPAMQRYLPAALDFRGPLHLDWAGTICALLLAMLAILLAGAAPAWMVARTQPQAVLHSESRLASESRGSKRLRRVLVAVEVTVSMALVLTTGLLTTSLFRLMHVDRGFEVDRVLSAHIDLPDKSYPKQEARAAFYQEALRHLSVLPGVEHAAVISQMPLSGDRWIDSLRVPGDSRPGMQLPTEHFRWISPDYFATVGMPLVAGRFLTPSDAGKNYAVISELTARNLWHGNNPIGQRFERGGESETTFTVIGVVGNARTLSLASPDPMMVYMPYWYRCDETAGLLVRTRQDPSLMANEVRKAIWSVDPGVPVPSVRTLSGVVADSLANRRFSMDLLLLFTVSALLLASLGVYGVVNYSVVQREREIGLRLALGAQRRSIYALMLRDGLAPVVVGAVAGTSIAFGLARVVASLLYGVSPYNPEIVSVSLCLLLAAGVVACLVPAHRAASVDPMQALRRE